MGKRWRTADFAHVPCLSDGDRLEVLVDDQLEDLDGEIEQVLDRRYDRSSRWWGCFDCRLLIEVELMNRL
jgi:hypothetical protein